MFLFFLFFFFFKQKTAYEMRISDWSSDVCSSDLLKTQSHDFWRTIYGPVVMRPGAFGWDARTAYAIRDANFDNNRMIEVWQAMDAAPDLDVFARETGRASCRERVCQYV